MKAIRTLALITGLLAIGGVCQAQAKFSSTWTAVSDYDFRGVSQSAKSPALQASADVTAGETGFSAGMWASNVDFDTPNNDNMELDLYANYQKAINDVFTFTAGVTYYDYPIATDIAGYAEFYLGANLGNFSFKQWYSSNFYGTSDSAMYTELNYTQALGDKFSLNFHVGYSWEDYWKTTVGDEPLDYAVQLNYTAGNFQLFGKFTGTDASGPYKVTTDVNNNEPRFLVGVTTTFPWGK